MDYPVAPMSASAIERPAPLLELRALRGGTNATKEEEADGLKFKAIRQEGLRVGAQAGLSTRYGQIMKYLEARQTDLDVTFGFAKFVRDGRMLIPAVVETPNQFKFDPQTGKATEIKNAITVGDEAKIVSVVPTWRDYLWQEYVYPDPPHPSLLPSTSAEVKAWQDAVDAGWKAGYAQADGIFDDRVNRLTMAVEGRALYITLEQQKVFTPAALRVVSNKVTFNGRTMNIGETIYAIDDQANYTNSRDWRPTWSK